MQSEIVPKNLPTFIFLLVFINSIAINSLISIIKIKFIVIGSFSLSVFNLTRIDHINQIEIKITANANANATENWYQIIFFDYLLSDVIKKIGVGFFPTPIKSNFN